MSGDASSLNVPSQRNESNLLSQLFENVVFNRTLMIWVCLISDWKHASQLCSFFLFQDLL